MGNIPRRAHRFAAKPFVAVLCVCLVVSSPGGAWALEALVPGPRAAQVPLSGAAKELFEDFAALLARSRPAPAGLIVEKGRQFRRHAPSAALDAWLSARLEGPLGSLSYWTAPEAARLKAALDGLPELRAILAGTWADPRGAKGASAAGSAGEKVSRLLDAFKGALPASPVDDLALAPPVVSAGAAGLAPAPRAAEAASPLPKRPEPPELSEMRRVREALYEQEKLAQRKDLSSPADEQRAKDIRDLDELIKGYESMLGEAGSTNGLRESEEAEAAWLKSMQRLFRDFQKPEERPSNPERPLTRSTTEQAIEARVSRIEDLKKKVQEGLAARDSTTAALAMADRARSGALKDRRSGKEMLEFRKNFARLAMVMDLTYGLNLLNSLDKALSGMQVMLDEKLKRIGDQRAANAANGAKAEEQKKREEEWRKAAQASVDEDRKNSGDFAKIADQAGKFVPRVEAFRADVAALLQYIDARDKGQSSGARAEYARRLALLPSMREKLIHGGGDTQGGLTLSLDDLQKLAKDVDGYIADSADAETKLSEVPLEFAGVLVILVPPSSPPVSVTNPGLGEVLQILGDKQVYWRGKEKEIQDMVDNLRKAMDASNTTRVSNDFGDSIPESLLVYLSEQRALSGRLRAKSEDLGGRIDALARSIRENVTSINLPTLAGRSADELRDLLPTYADALEGVQYPDTDAGFQAQMDKLSLVKLLPFIGDNTVQWLEAEATAEALEEATRDILPPAQVAAADALSAIKKVVADIDLDKAFINGGSPASGRQALIDRKRELILVTLRPMLLRAKAFLAQTLIPFQEKRILQADPNSTEDSLAVLYKEKDKFFVRIDDALKKTLPWGLASNGAREGDTAGARANIAKFRKKFEDYQQLVVDLQDSVRRREDPAGTELEDVYGEMAPYSLVVRERVYREEKVSRAAQFNARAGQFNAILRDMDAVSGSKHNLASRLSLPTDIAGSGPESVAKLKAIADNDVLQNTADQIKAVADAASAAAGGGSLDLAGANGSIPTGTQPPVELSPDLKLALLGLEAIKRLVPTTQTTAGDSIAETLARYLFSDALMESAIKNLRERIPIFKAFLNKAAGALADIFADCDADVAYVGGDLSGGDQVLARKIRVFTKIRDTAKEGADLFMQKAGWSAEAFETVTDVTGYYDSLGEVYSSGSEALDAEEKAAKEFQTTLADARKKVADQKREVTGWLKQLNDPHESALNRVSQNLSAIQEKTRSVLEANSHYHKMDKEFRSAEKLIKETLTSLSQEQEALSKELEKIGDISELSPDLARRVEAVTRQGSSWLAAGARGPQTLVIPKSQFSSFLGALFGAFDAESSSRDIVALREEILANPSALTQLLPGSKMVEVGEGASGFYLVYQSEFSTPHGLETTSQVTLGNVLNLWGNNISVTGHRFASPPSSGNAPFGDQGVSMEVESLQGENWVNYLNITFHKFIQDIPSDISVGAQAKEARMMIFDDFALLLNDGKLYFGAAGFADFAAENTKDKPYYYGGNFKASVKFTEVYSLNAEESILFAKDPRKFLQTVNLDFTKYDPDLDKDWVIAAEGENKTFRRDKVGVGVDLAKALEQKDSFKLDLFFSRVTGTDDMQQNAVGATVLKGFAFDVAGTSVATTVSGTGELGEQYNTFSGRISFDVPKHGIVLSAQGKMLGDADTYYLELRKKLGVNSDMFVSYGSKYVGLNHRLTIGAQSSFTLGELWRAVVSGTADASMGGDVLKNFNGEIDEYFKRDDPNNPLLGELEKVFASDVGKRLLTMEVGNLGRDLAELYKAGALMDNTRMRGMIGFVTNPVAGGTVDRATSGGFQVGTQTEMTLTKYQRGLIEGKIAGIYTAGVALQVRLLELSKAWQASLSELVLSRWDAYLAGYMLAQADDRVLRADAEARLVAAKARHRQAQLRYNSLTGRGPDETAAFDINPAEVDRLFGLMERTLNNPHRLAELVARLGPSMKLPEEPFNLAEWIPWVEKVTFFVGAQLQDILAGQALGAGVQIRLPVYDPGAKNNERAMVLQNDAAILEMTQALKSYRLRAHTEIAEAAAWDAQARLFTGESRRIAEQLWDAIRGYRNGLVPQSELWARFRRWHWNLSSLLNARAQGALKGAWGVLDKSAEEAWAVRPDGGGWTSEGVRQPDNLNQGFDMAIENSLDWEALSLRSQAAGQLLEASSSRISKVSVDVNIGINLTAAGVALIPAFGLTGLGIFPIVEVNLRPEELRQLSMERHSGEEKLYSRLQSKIESDLALKLYEAYNTFRAGEEALLVYENQVLPELEAAARKGGTRESQALDQGRAELEDLKGRQASTLATINFLMGRPLKMSLPMEQSAEAALRDLGARLQKNDPIGSRRDVLVSRVRIAQAVETVVDKNLKVQSIRLEPISLIGRSLGRLINALSGDGMPSPELVALARQQTLQAERDLEAFDRNLPAVRSRLGFELALAERNLEDLSGRTDGASRLRVVALRSKVRQLKAMLMAYGGATAEKMGLGTLPGTYGDLEGALKEAYAREAFSAENPDLARTAEGEASLQAQGTLRYYYAHQNLAKEPIGKSFVEGWVEVRLRSASTPPEALVALARLRQERADRLYASQQSAARAKAEILLARLRLNAGLLRAAPEAMRGDLQSRLERDFHSLAAHLRLPPSTRLEDVLRILPEEGPGDALAAAQRYLAQVASLDMDMLRRTLFQQGLPESVGASADPLLQLRANMIAEKMSYKGFTPMAAFGVFRGTWVSAIFLEAPDPIKIQKNLENILSEALVSELKSQEKLKALALKLHSLMASVSDKVKMVEAHRVRLDAARRNLLGMAARRRVGMASPGDLAAAADEASAAHEEFLEILTALHEDFVMLVTELEALGRDDLVTGSPAPYFEKKPEGPEERPAREQLLSYWSRRMAEDPDFAEKLLEGELLAGISQDMKKELRARLETWKQARANAAGVRADDFNGAETLDLLVRTDVQGRRQKVEETLSKILGELTRADPSGNGAWINLMKFLGSDVEKRAELSAGSVVEKGRVRDALRDAYWGAVTAPGPVDTGYRNLSRLSGRVDAARAEALQRFLETAGKPEDYILTDKALDEYVKALMAYDEEMIRVFTLPEVRRDPQWSRTLNGLFGLKASLDRRRDYLRYGRGIMSLDAAIQLGELRVNAFRREEMDRRDLSYAAEQLAFYQGMKQRWLADPKDLPTVYLVKGEASKDSPEKWLTARDLVTLGSAQPKQPQRLFEVEGRRFLFNTGHLGAPPKTAAEALTAGGREVVGGADSAQDRVERSRLDGENARRRLERDAALKTSELVLTENLPAGRLGGVTRKLSLAELRGLEKDGRVFYFRAKADPRAGGLRTAVHPLSALEMTPSELVILVQTSTSTPVFGRDKFPSLEALEASAELALFQRVELGAGGVRALIAEASAAELASRRRGWLQLKLEGYAYARDVEGDPAEIYVDEDELKEAKKTAQDPKSTAATSSWTFHLVSGLKIGLSQDKMVVRAEDDKFVRELPKGAEAVRWISEQPLALELDPEGRVERIWFERDRDDLEKEAPSWHLQDTTGKVWTRTDKNISPIHRLKRYVDPKKPQNAILLGRALLARRLSEAKSERGAVGRWSYMPWNWPNIILETPRGILKTPVELISGRDPNQEGYIGRVYMYRTEGGATERRGVLGSVVHFLDIFELLPDKVDRFMDPSQFPQRVDNDSPILPGEWEHEKSARTTDGEKNVHFGRGWLEREIRYASEDLADSKGRIMTSFRGGVRRTFIENTRGRQTNYDETRLDNKSGRVAMDEALKRVGGRTGADGSGKVEESPEHIAVDRVTAEIEIRLGAGQHARRRGKYEEYLKAPGPEKTFSPEEAKAAEEAALRDLAESEALRASLDKAARAATPWPLPAPVLPLVGGAAGLMR